MSSQTTCENPTLSGEQFACVQSSSMSHQTHPGTESSPVPLPLNSRAYCGPSAFAFAAAHEQNAVDLFPVDRLPDDMWCRFCRSTDQRHFLELMTAHFDPACDACMEQHGIVLLRRTERVSRLEHPPSCVAS